MNGNFALIFEIENDAHLLSFKTEDDIPIYLMAKYYLLRDTVMCKMLNLKTSGNDRKINAAAFRFVGKALLHNITHNRILHGRDIVFYTVCRPTIVDGKYFNRYTDYYADLLENKTATIEQTAMDWRWPFPRNNDAVLFDGIETIKERISGKIRCREDLPRVEEFIKYFNNRLEKMCGFRLSNEECTVAVTKIALLISSMRKKTKWLEHTIPDGTKILISTGGSYPHYFPINRMLKKRGILSADLQHGFITETNLMYNFAPAIVACNEVKEGSSDYFLTYGDWWNAQINGPSIKVSIGNPYRDSCVAKINPSKKTKRILFIGCEINTENYVRMTKELSEQLPDYEVVFRPHPGEVNNTRRILQENNIDIKLDDISEVYDSLEKTSIVVSEVSTVLFEAIGIADEIVVLNTDYSQSYLPNHPFKVCNTANDIADIAKHNDKQSAYSKDMIWADCWEKNYLEFLSEVGIK